MFQLSSDHLNAFRGTVRETFELRGIQHLRRRLTSQTAQFDDSELRARIRSCIPRAGHYGLTTQRQVMAFVDASYLSHEHFDTDPNCQWAGPVLTDQELTADLKAKLLVSFAYQGA